MYIVSYMLNYMSLYIIVYSFINLLISSHGLIILICSITALCQGCRSFVSIIALLRGISSTISRYGIFDIKTPVMILISYSNAVLEGLHGSFHIKAAHRNWLLMSLLHNQWYDSYM